MASTATLKFLEDRWDDAVASTLDAPELLRYRSNLLGSDLRLTNFGGGNTSSKLDEIDPALPGFKVRDERLMASECLGQFALLEAGLLAILDQEFGQASMAGRSQRAWHAGPGRREPAG